MLKENPKFGYCGLTIVMSNPSRFDKVSLLSAAAGELFNKEMLRPEINRFQCEVRLADDRSTLRLNTKALLLLGQKALTLWTDSKYTLGEIRGYPLYSKEGIPSIASYLPQDACDVRDYELMLNEEVSEYRDTTDKYTTYEGEKKHGKTARSNFRFWLKSDVERIKQVLFSREGKFPHDVYSMEAVIQPNSDHMITRLREAKDTRIYIDLETDEEFNIRCIGLMFEPDPCHRLVTVYLIPFLDYNYNPSYSIESLCQLYRALALAFSRNIVVAHNGSVFDFFVLAWKYRLAVGTQLEDTMLEHQRCWPTVEKSLGHCMSHLCWQPYHKDEGNFTFRTQKQMENMFLYCCKDVFGMFLCKKAMEFLASEKHDVGLQSSMQQANASIYPYLVTSLLGMLYDKEAVAKKINENDRLATQCMRIMRILHGKDIAPLISNKNCIQYFHEALKYPVIKRSAKTGKPSLSEKELLALRLRFPENAVIEVLLKYRHMIKQTGDLSFLPWPGVSNGNSSKS